MEDQEDICYGQCQFEELPYDVLMNIGRILNAKELSTGLLQTNHKFLELFGDISYWEDRMRSDSKDYFDLIHDEKADTDMSTRVRRLRQKVFSWEQTNRVYRRKTLNPVFLGEEGEQILWNITALEFGGEGTFLAFASRDRTCVSVWNLENLLAQRGESSLSFCHDHDQDVKSLRTRNSQISSGSYDGTITIRDLNHLDGPPKQALYSAGLVESHIWPEEHFLLSGTRGGTLEGFDIRTGNDPVIRKKVFTSSEICHHFQLRTHEHYAVLAGWDAGVRKLKLFDIRMGETVLANEISSWHVSMDIGDGQLWIGGDKGKVFQYNPATLERIENFTSQFGHTANNGWLSGTAHWECVRSVLYADGHIITTDLRQVKLHEYAKKPRLLWEEEIVFSELAFCKERCLLAASVGHTLDQIKIFLPLL